MASGGNIAIITDRSTLQVAPDSVRFQPDLSGATFDTPAGDYTALGFDKDHHDLTFIWDFGDSDGTEENDLWTYLTDVPPQWRRRSMAIGPWPTHVYRKPGTYTVTLLVKERDSGKASKAQTTVVVGDPDALYDGTGKTVWISPVGDSDFSGAAPADANNIHLNMDQIPTADNAATYSAATETMAGGDGSTDEKPVRRMLKRDGTYQMRDIAGYYHSSGQYLGAFGTGANPIVEFPDAPYPTYGGFALAIDRLHSDAGGETRIVDIDFKGNAGSRFDPTQRLVLQGAPVASITNANPAVATLALPGGGAAYEHGLSTGDEVFFQSCQGLTEVNDTRFTITVLSENTFSLDGFDSSGLGTYTADSGILQMGSGGGAVSLGNYPSDLIISNCTIQGFCNSVIASAQVGNKIGHIHVDNTRIEDYGGQYPVYLPQIWDETAQVSRRSFTGVQWVNPPEAFINTADTSGGLSRSPYRNQNAPFQYFGACNVLNTSTQPCLKLLEYPVNAANARVDGQKILVSCCRFEGGVMPLSLESGHWEGGLGRMGAVSCIIDSNLFIGSNLSSTGIISTRSTGLTVQNNICDTPDRANNLPTPDRRLDELVKIVVPSGRGETADHLAVPITVRNNTHVMRRSTANNTASGNSANPVVINDLTEVVTNLTEVDNVISWPNLNTPVDASAPIDMTDAYSVQLVGHAGRGASADIAWPYSTDYGSKSNVPAMTPQAGSSALNGAAGANPPLLDALIQWRAATPNKGAVG